MRARADGDPIPVGFGFTSPSEREGRLALFGGPLTPFGWISQPAHESVQTALAFVTGEVAGGAEQEAVLCKGVGSAPRPKGRPTTTWPFGAETRNARGAPSGDLTKPRPHSLKPTAGATQSGTPKGHAGIILAYQIGASSPWRGAHRGRAAQPHHATGMPRHFGVSDNDRVCVRLDGERPLINCEDVLVRAQRKFRVGHTHRTGTKGNSSAAIPTCPQNRRSSGAGHGFCTPLMTNTSPGGLHRQKLRCRRELT
jgi:hypothetical protein